jgi:ATP-dependent RNA helicase DbpA
VSVVEFSELALPAELLEGLRSLGFTRPLPVQAQALPPILAGQDVIVRAQTGSGKTLAFGLGMLARLEPRLDVQGLVLCPTRELSEQVAERLRQLARRTPNVKVLSLCGGVPFAPQRASLVKGAHVVVGTPGRLEEHVRKGSLSLSHVSVLVLDEADRMLDMGFEPQIAKLVAHAPRERQSLLFSATYPPKIEQLSRAYQRGALFIDVALSVGPLIAPPARAEAALEAPGASEGDEVGGEPVAGRVEEHFHRVPSAKKLAALVAWLERERPESALVFCNTRVECDQAADALRGRGWVAASIHGEMAQRDRQHVMRLFANGSCTVLVATDVAARGWDLPDLPVVIQLGLPREPTSYVHRSGRTGRLGRSGKVVSFVTEEDAHALGAIEHSRGGAVAMEPAPAPQRGGAPPPRPKHVTLLLSAGKDKKLRAGDLLGALTGEGGVSGSDVGSIQIDERASYVAIAAEAAERALARLAAAGVKGRSVKARVVGLALREAGS